MSPTASRGDFPNHNDRLSRQRTWATTPTCKLQATELTYLELHAGRALCFCTYCQISHRSM